MAHCRCKGPSSLFVGIATVMGLGMNSSGHDQTKKLIALGLIGIAFVAIVSQISDNYPKLLTPQPAHQETKPQENFAERSTPPSSTVTHDVSASNNTMGDEKSPPHAEQKETTAPSSPAQPAPDFNHPTIFSHRAHYTLQLESVRNTSPVRAVNGEMTTDWVDACQGWMVNQTLTLFMTYNEAPEAKTESYFSTWEAKDNSHYRFNYRHLINGNSSENIRGTATIDNKDGTGKVHYVLPEEKTLDLPTGTLFPTTHTLFLMREALNKTPLFLNRPVFDGSDDKGVSQVSAIIKAPQPVTEELTKNTFSNVKNLKAWPMRLAFFSNEENASEPDYEMDTNMLPNSVSEYMMIDYGDFKVKGTLDKLEPIAAPSCD